MQHHEAFETDRLSRIALENLMGSELLALDRIARPAKKLKALNSAGVALRAGTQGVSVYRRIPAPVQRGAERVFLTHTGRK